MKEKEKEKENEFKSAEALHRFEAGIMLGQTAVYLMVSGALANAVITCSKPCHRPYELAIAAFGVLLSGAFFVIIRRCGLNLRGARDRAHTLAKELRYDLYGPNTRARANRFFTGRNVTQAICVAGGLFWLAFLLRALFA